MSTSGTEPKPSSTSPAQTVFLTVFLAMLLAFLGPEPIRAQTDDPSNDHLLAGAPDIRFENLTSEDGLSHNGVFAIVQDRTGFMWIGTSDGLNRYDGYEFTILRHDPQNPASLSDSWVRALLVDREGNLWVASRGGLDRIDGETQAISRYQHDPDNPTSLTAGPVFSLYEDRSGTLWIGTEQGLNSKSLEADSFVHYQHDPNNPNSISHSTVWAMHEDENGLLWLGTQGGGLNALDLETGKVVSRYRHDPNDPNSLSDDRVWAIHEDADGVLWLGTQGGLNAFDRKTERFTRYQHDPGDPHSLGNDLVKAIYEDSHGVLWVGAWGGGLNRLDRETGRFTRYQHDPLDLRSLANDKVAAIYEDDGGILWVGIWGGGLSRFDRAQEQFAHYYHDPGDSNSLSDSTIHSMYEVSAGALWIGTVSALNRFDRATGEFTRYQHDPHDPSSINVGEAVVAIHQDARGHLWVSGWAEGLNRFDPTTGHFEHVRYDAENPSSLSSDVVLSLYTDRDGVLWIGTLNGGLNRFDHQTESFEAFRHDPAEPSSLSEDHVHVIYEDAAGVLWLGTGAGGLNRFDRQTGKFRVYRNDPDDPNSLSSNRVNAIHQDLAGVLWIGTPTGLNRLVPAGDPDSQDATFDHYTEKEGLPSNAIQAILEDDGGRLWLSTTRGLSGFDPQTETFKNYDAADGLQGNEFAEGAALRDSQGLMYFGGSNGLTGFHPGQIIDNAYIPPVILTDLRLLNQPVPVGGELLLQKAIWNTEMLTLSHKDQVVTFDFAALSFADPESNLYRYRLEGFEDGWSPPGHQRSATYTNLDPGEYVFRVVGSNDDGVWNEEGASLKITVTPPWWATWWFRGLVLGLLIGLAYGAYRWQVRNIQARSRELEQEVADRTRELQEEITGHEETEQRLRRARDELATVMAVSQDIVSTLELDTLLHLILEHLLQVVDYHGAGILIFKDEDLHFRAYQGMALDPRLGSLIIPVAGVAPMRQAMFERQAFIIDSLRQEPELSQQLQAATGLSMDSLFGDAQAWLGMPLIVGDRVIGLLGCVHREPAFYNADDLQLAQVFANQAAIALENAQLYEQAQAAAVAEERNRLARDLHDSVTQSIYSASLVAEVLPEIWRRNPDELEQGLDDLRHLTRGALAEMRTMLLELRPASLLKTPLDDLLKQLAEAATNRTELQPYLEINTVPTLSPEVHINFYRVAQEALNNVVKHAGASQVKLSLLSSPALDSLPEHERQGQLELRIRDDGQGFDPSQIPIDSLGLSIMRERAEEIKSVLTIDSQPGQGTTVTLVWQNGEYRV